MTATRVSTLVDGAAGEVGPAKRRALLVGAETNGLTGVHNDLAAMSRLLAAFGFEVRTCREDTATRASILAHFDQLIDDSEQGDAAVFYYSGHGSFDEGRVTPTGEATLAHVHQFIVTTDCDQTTVRDFRGILNLELARCSARLARKTRNVAVILDCCHAQNMSLESMEVPRSVMRPKWYPSVEAHVSRMEYAPLSSEDREAISSNVVRLAATEFHRPAYEGTVDGVQRGSFSHALEIALAEIGQQSVTWRRVLHRARELVLRRNSDQRPALAGPASRLVFGLDHAWSYGETTYVEDDGRPAVRAGRLLGAERGSVYAVMPLPARSYEPGRELARATVTDVLGDVSRVRLDPPAPTGLKAGCPAFPIEPVFRRRSVSIAPEGCCRDEIATAIGSSDYVRVTEDGEAGELGSIELATGEALLRAPGGSLWRNPIAPLPGCGTEVARALEELAKADALRNVGAGGLDTPFRVAWGSVDERGARTEHALVGARLGASVRCYVEVENESDDPIYVGVASIGAGGRIEGRNGAFPDGVLLERKGSRHVFGGPEGFPFAWPEDVPADGPRRANLIVVASDAPQDLAALHTRSELETTGDDGLESMASGAFTTVAVDFSVGWK